jgi:23S rRNA (pseudouridine1915-N3)-methyltransferase
MLDITIVAVDRIKNNDLAGAIAEYLVRLKPYASIKTEEVRPEPFGPGTKEKSKKMEGERLLKILGKYPAESIWLMHEEGQEFTSMALTKKIEAAGDRAVFVLGGALGFSDEILNKYKQFSLSRLTFPHELARLILIEQIYRVATIARGKEYHY